MTNFVISHGLWMRTVDGTLGGVLLVSEEMLFMTITLNNHHSFTMATPPTFDPRTSGITLSRVPWPVVFSLGT